MLCPKNNKQRLTLFALGSGRSVSGTVGAFSASSRYDVSSSKARSSPKASSSGKILEFLITFFHM